MALLEHYFDSAYLLVLLTTVQNWLRANVLTFETLIEVGLVVSCLALAYLLAPPITKPLMRLLETRPWAQKMPGSVLKAILRLMKFFLAILLLWIAHAAAKQYGLPGLLVDMVASLMTAWVIIRLATSLLGNSNWVPPIATFAWAVAALHIVKLLDPTIVLLDRAAITMGGLRISILLLIKGVIIFALLLRLAGNAAGFLEKRVQKLEGLTPSVQVLLTKSFKVTLVVVAVVVALGSLGIDLSAFAFIGGAIGVGIGFGLQKVVSNLISGVILLLDKSIKPGDVIEVGDSYGRIESLGARYVSVVTRDGFEYLIPNEDLITQQVINWSFTDKFVRLKIAIGISYTSDLHKAMALVVQAAKTVPRVLTSPAPVCQLKDFGESSLDLQLRFWIADPELGTANVSSAVRVAIWDLFAQHNIEIPFPQRDIHIKTTAA
jgi:small-conductance mechanosensitive channel